MRRIALGLIALLITAGCLAASASTESASSLQGTAEDRKDERANDGRLVALWGVEPPRHVEGDQDRLDIYLDETPGDGEATGWTYAYLGHEKAGAVATADTLGVVAEYWHTFEENNSEAVEEVPAIDDWQIDSTEAADILADHEDWPEITESWGVLWSLYGTPRGPVWSVYATNITFDGFGTSAQAALSASNGTVFYVEQNEGFAEPGQPPAQAGSESAAHSCGQGQSTDSGQASAVSDVNVELVADGEPVTVNGAVTYSVGVGTLELALLDDDGDEVWTDSVSSSGGSGGVSFTVDDLEEGTYEIEASTTGAFQVTIEGEITWGSCGDDADEEQEDASADPVRQAYGPIYPADRRPAASLYPNDPSLGVNAFAQVFGR